MLAALPVLATSLPQMTDYPSHLARWQVMLGNGNPHYHFAWRWSGNLGADLLIRPLAALVGLEPAGRLLCALVPVATGLGIVAVEWALRRRIGPGGLLAMATIWSPAMAMGMLNFGIGLALALFAFALWIRLELHPGRRAILFVPLGLIVWLCHAAGWGVLAVLAGCYEYGSRPFAMRRLFAPWPLALPLIAQFATAVPVTSLSGRIWGANPGYFKVAIWLKALRDQSFGLDFFSVLLILAAFLFAALGRKLDRRLAWAALALALLTLAMPRHFGGGDYADYRLVSVALMAACLAISWRPPGMVTWLVPALFLVRLAVTTEAARDNGREAEAMLAVLPHIPEGARVAFAIAEDPADWPLNPFEHIASYASIRRRALVNTHFAIPGLHMLSLRDASPAFADPSQRLFLPRGTRPDLANFAPAREADWLWYSGEYEPARLPPGSQVVWRAPHTLLARLAKAPGGG